MDTLIVIASRVEAALQAYIAVRYITDVKLWEEKLKAELVSAHLHADRSIYVDICNRHAP